MKTAKNLFPKLCTFENLFLAFQKAQRGKRFRTEVFHFAQRLEENLFTLQKELRENRWEPGNYREFFVREPKPRLISAAPYRDRVVHHALLNVIEPRFERGFIFDSYACRPGKGTHAAADRYSEFSRRARYVLKCDISRFFPTVRHDVLLSELARKIGDRRTLDLCERILRAYGDAGLLWPVGRGIPIGNLTSQFFANVYLDRFDHWIKEEMKCRFYLRYVDDFVILDDDKVRLQTLIPAIEGRFDELGLKLHDRKRQVFPISEGCDFMGYRIWPNHRRIRSGNGYRFRRRFLRMATAFRKGGMSTDEVRNRVMSWIGHARHADTWGLRRSIFQGIPLAGPKIEHC